MSDIKNSGVVTELYENGQKYSESTFKEDGSNERTTMWYETGRKMTELIPQNENGDEQQTWWDESGQIKGGTSHKDRG